MIHTHKTITIIKKGGVAIFSLAPLFAFAQPQNLNDVAQLFINIFRAFVPVLIGFAVLIFIWGIVRFIAHMDNEQERAAGKKLMVWGVVALFVIVSVWGLVGILLGTFGLTNPVVPFFPPPK